MAVPVEITYPGGPGLATMNSGWVSAGPGRRPAMLILRGVAGPMEGYFRIAETVASWGFHALVHNWQLRGNAPTDEETFSDLREAYAYLDGRADVDRECVGLMGFCKGGTFAFLAATQRPTLIGVAVFHGFCRRLPSEQHLLQPYQLVGKVRPPMLFMHGTADTQAPIQSMRTLLAGLQAHEVQASLHEYEGVEHGFAVTTHPGYEPSSAQDSMARAQRFFEGLRSRNNGATRAGP